MRHVALSLLVIMASISAPIIGPASAAGWPADHINSLSDIRCRLWCSHRFREGAAQVLVGPGAAGVRRYLVGDSVKRLQDRHQADLAAEMAENASRFRAYYRRSSSSSSSSGGGGANRRPAAGGQTDQTVQWFNLYHEYLYCLRDCFEP